MSPTMPPEDSSDAGLASVWIAAALPGLIAIFLVSFALWSGYNVRQQLAEIAEAGARSGAGAIDADAFNATGELTLVESDAIAFAGETIALNRSRLAKPEVITAADVSIEDDRRVIVEMTGQVELLVLGRIPVRAIASAEPRQIAPTEDPAESPTPAPPADP